MILSFNSISSITFALLAIAISCDLISASQNIALGKFTTASSSFGGWEDYRAVDGDIGTSFHSAQQLNSLWILDFKALVTIDQIKLVNRQDCCQDRLKGAKLEIIDGYGNAVVTEVVDSETVDILTLDYDPPTEGMLIRITHPTAYLNFAELEVYGEIGTEGLYNIAEGKTTSSSIGLPGMTHEYALDGSRDTFFHAGDNKDGWWMVDFETTAFIRQITLFNRKQCCQERMNNTVIDILADDGSIVASQTITEVLDVYMFGFYNKPEGRFVRITNPNEYLHFSNIEIFGAVSIDGLDNIALGQSVTSSEAEDDHTAPFASDGHPGTYFLTKESENVVWQMDFHTVVFIRQISIYTREDCCKEYLKDAVVSIIDVKGNVVASQTITNEMNSVINLRFPDDPQGQLVQITQANNYLTFGEVEIYGDFAMDGISNLALNKQADASSAVPGFEASTVVDGNFDSELHTITNVDNWWMVDLGQMADIRQIKIFNRQDCCQDRLHGATVTIFNSDHQAMYSMTIQEAEPDIVQINLPDITGEFVGIFLDTAFLHLREVEVYGKLSNEGLDNLAAGKPTEQSSTFGDSDAFKAVDGDLTTTSQTTTSDSVAYWIVDLEAVGVIKQIKIHSRLNCCRERLSGAEVSILSEDKGTTLATQTILQATPDVVELNFQDIEGRYAKISLSSGEPLELGQVEVYGTWIIDRLPNLALGKPAFQSTTWDNHLASNAVDGDYQSFSHSVDETGNWWYVDLQQPTHIRSIKVYNRQDCCHERILGAIVQIEDSNGNVVGQKVINSYEHVGYEFEFPDVVGNVVKILSDTFYLHIAEVEVYGYYSNITS